MLTVGGPLGIEETDLGNLSLRWAGSGGQVYGTSFRLPGDPAPLLFLRFTADRAAVARSAAAVIAFRKELPDRERKVLDGFANWPRELVRDREYATGFLLPEVPAEFHLRMPAGYGGDRDSRRVLSLLTADEAALEAGRAGDQRRAGPEDVSLVG